MTTDPMAADVSATGPLAPHPMVPTGPLAAGRRWRISARIATAVGLTAALVAGFAPAANAGTGSSLPKGAGLSAWKSAVDVRIDLRLRTLAALKIAISGATNLTSSDKATLTGIVSSDVSGLTALRTKTDAETTITAVRADGRSMVVDYRIYLLVVPKVRFAIASDTETAVIARLRTVHDKLAAVAAQLQSQGKDVSSELAELTDLSSRLDAATTTLDGKAAALLAVAPSPDATAMRAAVAPVRTAVRAARDDIRAAIVEAKKVRDGLKALS